MVFYVFANHRIISASSCVEGLSGCSRGGLGARRPSRGAMPPQQKRGETVKQEPSADDDSGGGSVCLKELFAKQLDSGKIRTPNEQQEVTKIEFEFPAEDIVQCTPLTRARLPPMTHPWICKSVAKSSDPVPPSPLMLMKRCPTKTCLKARGTTQS